MEQIANFQRLYALLGAGYNLVSIARVRFGRSPLSATDPWAGLTIMAITAAITLTHPYLQGSVYLLGWIGVVLMLVCGPLNAHSRAILQGRNIEQYSSLSAAWLAFGINLFGLAAGCVGIVTIISRLTAS